MSTFTEPAPHLSSHRLQATAHTPMPMPPAPAPPPLAPPGPLPSDPLPPIQEPPTGQPAPIGDPPGAPPLINGLR